MRFSSSRIFGPCVLYNIQEPAYLAGEFKDSISTKFNWTQEFKNQFQEWRRFSDHDMLCYNNIDNRIEGLVNYPQKLVVYEPQDTCKPNRGDKGAATQIITPFTNFDVLLGFNKYIVLLVTNPAIPGENIVSKT